MTPVPCPGKANHNAISDELVVPNSLDGSEVLDPGRGCRLGCAGDKRQEEEDYAVHMGPLKGQNSEQDTVEDEWPSDGIPNDSLAIDTDLQLR